MTRLAVVIPLFDKRDFIGEAIASLALQEMPPDMLVVVDDASTDGSTEAAEAALALHAEAFAATRIELVRHPRNLGPGAARNSGIERADCELLLCLDADDSLRPDALRRVREAMSDHALAMLVLGYASDPPGEVFPELDAMPDELSALGENLLLLEDPLSTAAHPDFIMGRASNVAVRRDAIGAHRYCTEARLNEGVDFWYRVLRDVADGGGRAGLCAAPLIRFRISEGSLSHRRFADWRALEVPPTVRRWRDSADPRDRRMAAMLVGRWVEHALVTLPEAQRAPFLAHHRALVSEMAE